MASAPPNTVPPKSRGRDQRIDFLRGIAMFMLLFVHSSTTSYLTPFTWERIGLITAAEIFVVLAGFVVGEAYYRRALRNQRGGLYALCKRGGTLYWTNLKMVTVVGLLSFVPFLDVTEITTFLDPYTGVRHSLYPQVSEGLGVWINRFLYLQAGPHQYQIIGLYAGLLIGSPLVLWLLIKHKTPWIMLGSWSLYFLFLKTGWRPTGAQFEYAFPILAWQLPFVHGMLAGVHRVQLVRVLTGKWRPILATVIFTVYLAGLFFSWNNPSPAIPAYLKLNVIPPDVFNYYYFDWASKNQLGLIRILTSTASLFVFYGLATVLWKKVCQPLAWFFVPLGRESLKVFTAHVFVIGVFSQWKLFGNANPWVDSASQLVMVAGLWFFVRPKKKAP